MCLALNLKGALMIFCHQWLLRFQNICCVLEVPKIYPVRCREDRALVD